MLILADSNGAENLKTAALNNIAENTENLVKYKDW